MPEDDLDILNPAYKALIGQHFFNGHNTRSTVYKWLNKLELQGDSEVRNQTYVQTTRPSTQNQTSAVRLQQ